jgi:hypothetical protein
MRTRRPCDGCNTARAARKQRVPQRRKQRTNTHLCSGPCTPRVLLLSLKYHWQCLLFLWPAVVAQLCFLQLASLRLLPPLVPPDL